MRISTPFRPLFASSTYRSLAFLAAALPMAAATLAALIAGWTATAVLAITPLVVPVLIGFRAVIGALARADGALARSLLGTQITPRMGSGGRGFWGRGKAVLVDAAFWRQQVYLALRMTLGFAFAVGELSLIAGSLGWALFPVWYRWSDLQFGAWQVDTFARSFVVVPAGIAGLVVAGQLARLLGAGSAWLVRSLLTDARAADAPTAAARRRALAVHAGAAGALAALTTLIWALTGAGYFWPEWVILPLLLLLAMHAWIELVEELPALRRHRALSVCAGISTAVVVFLVLVWAVTGGGYFWPAWPMLGAAIVLIVWAAAVVPRRDLARRVDVLETTRAGAVDAQGAELRRIERDLHDGAQARLVALGMNLGMAEQKLASDPAAAQQLVAEARLGVADALRELRDLARGIHPPVLSDRGLGAALATLADRSALPVSVSVSLDARLAPAVEAAAYFVVAEAVTNAAKHSAASRVGVHVCRRGDTLELEVEDDGRGGADPRGGGLAGLRRRVEALDGTLAVTSPPGGPTIVRAELPCGS
jgi:signal transduction histidine kinase